MKKINQNVVTCSIFLGFIFTLTFLNVFSSKAEYSENENRNLSPLPTLNMQNIFAGKFDDEFESWFSDHFTMRDMWIPAKARIRSLTGSIENNDVYLGKNGALIQKFSSYNETIVKNNISYINEFCSENDIQANVMIVPDAAYGQSDLLPTGSFNIDEGKLISKIQKELKDQNFINITKELAETKNDYFKTDHHWNETGAKIGYDAICREVLQKEPQEFQYLKVSDSFKGTMYSKSGAFWDDGDDIYMMSNQNTHGARISYEDGSTSASLFINDNLGKKDKYTYYLDGNHAYAKITTSVKNKRKALIVKDSFSHILIPYLASEYSEIELVDLRYYRNGVSQLLDHKENTDFYVIYSVETFCTDTNLAGLW